MKHIRAENFYNFISSFENGERKFLFNPFYSHTSIKEILIKIHFIIILESAKMASTYLRERANACEMLKDSLK